MSLDPDFGVTVKKYQKLKWKGLVTGIIAAFVVMVSTIALIDANV
jgi:hypothetical protein